MDKVTEVDLQQPRKSLLWQYLATATATLAVITSGMHFGWPSPTLPQLLSTESPIPITSSDGSWIAVMPCIGGPLGAILGAFVVDRIGRKSTMMIVSPWYFIAWLAIAYSPNLWLINIARFVVGIMDGIVFTVLPMYIGEISDRRIRGMLGSCLATGFVSGFLLINILGLYFTIKATALIASLVPVMHFITFIWMPESPYYYLLQQNVQKATSSLMKLTGATNVQEEIKILIAESIVIDKGHSKYLSLVTEKSNRKALTIVLGLRLIQQFCGNYAIAFYCLMIFNEAGGIVSGPSATIIYFSVQLLTSSICSMLVDKAGRRPLLLISIIGSSCALAAQGIYFYLKVMAIESNYILVYVPLIALILYNILFNIGLSTIPLMMLGELFPTNVKGFALCIVDIFYSAFILMASKFFQIMNDRFGMHVPFLAFAVCCVFGVIFIVFCVPETKGKSLEQIQKELRGETSYASPGCDIESKGVAESLLGNSVSY